MNRREFFQYTAAAGSLLGLPVLASQKQTLTLNVISRITPETSVPHLRSVLETFIDNGLPVSCIVHTIASDDTPLSHNSNLAKLLRKLLQQAAGLIEIVGYADNLSNQSPHFQARSAFETRKRLIDALVSPENPDTSLQFQSLASAATENPTAPLGIRSAGFRNLLLLPVADTSVTPEIWDNGTMRLIGGTHVSLRDRRAVGQHLENQYHNINILDASEFGALQGVQLANSALEYAGEASHFETAGQIGNQRLQDLQLRDDYGFQRLVGVHLFEPPPDNSALVKGFEALKSELAALKISFSWGKPIALKSDEKQGSGYWLGTEADGASEALETKAGEVKFAFVCHGDTHALERRSDLPLPAGVGLTASAASTDVQGIDPCGHLRFPVVSENRLIVGGTSDTLASGPTSDLVIVVDPANIVTKAQRAVLLRKIKTVKSDWVTRMVPLGNFASTILPQSPLISLYRRTEAARGKTASLRRKLSDQQRDQFTADAKIAWSYFTRFTNAKTGLCPATVNFAPGGKRLHEAVTMWDVGSQILALIAAVDLDLISEKAFRAAISRVIPNIVGRRSQGRLLPQGWIRTDKHKWGNANFDGCDAGRLLSALWNLKQHRYADSRVSDLVGSWDLEKVIVDGAIQSVIDKEFKSTYGSQCAHYSAISFRRWGLDVKSPYEVPKDLSDCDQKMAVLEATTRISPIGAEPLLLEAVELGHASETKYLAEVLQAAQIEDYEKSGVLVCASEGPIDKEPWFTYQGLKLDATKDRWVIDTVGDMQEFKNPEFQRSAQVVSSKASYLWAAHAPNDHSDRLLEYVRAKSKSKNGFASSIYSVSGQPTANYSDLNTNGIILQAIAQVMKNQT
ncbi:MAG: DUF3131 domain-containing protein [Rhodobacteraceae bacterium]|nr:DUF3131 domain-containing protein [Paracoccaceae bacterium]